METTVKQPPSASAGGDNAYYLPRCELVERSPSYASCLWKINENVAGRSADYPSHADCIGPIESRRCPALGMRQEEELKGEAMYYFPRQFINQIVITSLTPADQIPKRTEFKNRLPDPIHRGPKPVPASVAPRIKRIEPVEPVTDYAAAINAAMTSLATAPVAPAAARLAMLPGETPMQYARRRAEENNQPKETT